MVVGAPRPLAGLSIDLDNHWAYLRSRGDPAWQSLPTYFSTVVPRIHRTFAELGVTATAFVVGLDLTVPENHDPILSLHEAGYEIGNHSYAHRVDFDRLDEAASTTEIARTEDALVSLGIAKPAGFRGPSFRLSQHVLETLIARGYIYDSTIFPTFAGPLARVYYRLRIRSDGSAEAAPTDLFGSLRDGFRSLRPYRWVNDTGALIELPVSTFPAIRMPIHFTYYNFLADVSTSVADTYLRAAMRLYRLLDVTPCLLLHPTDFIGADDSCCPRFLPGMQRPSAVKIATITRALTRIAHDHELVSLVRIAQAAAERGEKLAALNPAEL